jgi:hypothetical protein
MTREQIEKRLVEIRDELQRLKLEAREVHDRQLERQLDSAWRELAIGRSAFA